MSRAELEKKQQEYMEAAMSMAKKAGNAAPSAAPPPVIKEELVEEIVEAVDDLSGVLEEIKEKAEEKAAAGDTVQETAEETEKQQENDKFGVFSTEELVTAIENGDVSSEGLKQATEILEEMTRKTEAMRRLVEEQESEDEFADGGDYGLNGFVNRHNSHCRGCGNESHTQSP